MFDEYDNYIINSLAEATKTAHTGNLKKETVSILFNMSFPSDIIDEIVELPFSDVEKIIKENNDSKQLSVQDSSKWSNGYYNYYDRGIVEANKKGYVRFCADFFARGFVVGYVKYIINEFNSEYDEGISEKKKKVTINLFNMNFTNDFISEVLDISIPQVEKIIIENSGNNQLSVQ